MNIYPIHYFADDMLIFCRANKASFKELNHLLEMLHMNSGLDINRSKSKLFVSKGCKQREELVDIIGVSFGLLPIKYLGLPLSHNYLKVKDFIPLVDKIKMKVDGWMAKLVSFAGRVELIKSVLNNYLSLWVQSFRIPIQSLLN